MDGNNRHGANWEWVGAAFCICKFRAQIRIFHREMWWCQYTRDHFLGVHARVWASKYINFCLTAEQGFEERQAHDMIPVGVCKNEVVLMNALFDEFVSEFSNPGSGIDNDDITASGLNLNTGGVPAIFEIFPA